MSEENVEIYRRVLDAWNRADVDFMLSYMDADVEISSFLIVVEGGYHGHEGVRRWWHNFHDTFPDWHVEIGEVLEVGDATVARLHMSGHGRESGVPVDELMWHVVRWREGKAIRLTSHAEETEALEAAGLSE